MALHPNFSASPDDEDTMDYFLGRRPSGATTDSKVDLGMIVRDIDEHMGMAVFLWVRPGHSIRYEIVSQLVRNDYRFKIFLPF